MECNLSREGFKKILERNNDVRSAKQAAGLFATRNTKRFRKKEKDRLEQVKPARSFVCGD